MQLLPEQDFSQWMDRGGIGAHPECPLNLTFIRAPGCRASWLPTGRVSDLPGFLQTALGVASTGGSVWVYRKGGGVWYEGSDAPIGNHIIDRVLAAIAVPLEFAGALGFDRTEWRDLNLLISTFFVWGWSVGEDLYVIPKNGSCLLMTSHHGELFADFPSEVALSRFRSQMLQAGHLAR